MPDSLHQPGANGATNLPMPSFAMAEEAFRPLPVVTEELSGKRAAPAPAPCLFPEEGRQPPRRVIPMRSVVCYECGQVSEVPRAALSAHCAHCNAHVALGDVTLLPGSPKTRIRTQGDVRVHPRAVLSHLDIACHRLDMQGVAAGNFHCTGTLTISSSPVIDGCVVAHNLHLRKKAHVTLRREARVHEAYISGILEGNLVATGTVRIAKTGQLLGDVKAGALVVNPGGIHRGHRLDP